MPRAMPPCGGAPYCRASSRKPNRSRACLLVDPQQAEHLLLQLLVVDTNRAAARFVAVDHQVVRLRAALLRVAGEQFAGPAAAAR